MKYDEDIKCCTGYLCPLHERCVRYMNFHAYESKYHDFDSEIPLDVMSAQYDYEKDECKNFLRICDIW